MPNAQEQGSRAARKYCGRNERHWRDHGRTLIPWHRSNTAPDTSAALSGLPPVRFAELRALESTQASGGRSAVDLSRSHND